MEHNTMSQEQMNLPSISQSDDVQTVASPSMDGEQTDRLVSALARLERQRLLCIARDQGIPIALPWVEPSDIGPAI